MIKHISNPSGGLERFMQRSSLQRARLTVCFRLAFRVKIVKENALPDIENYMFEQHDQLRQAATECMCNLVTCKEVRMNNHFKKD